MNTDLMCFISGADGDQPGVASHAFDQPGVASHAFDQKPVAKNPKAS